MEGRPIADCVVSRTGYIASQGKNVEDALGNLREAIELYLEDEDAKIPTDRSAILTTLSVQTHAQAGTSVRQ
ncbi:MAG: type II toxin-antitoxin system HicB family antitoxin [Nitrososphaerota archaeon]|nr:type II toxin-antitoxin system HicB family antitoxin [Nitrososphaerota archaeon]